MRIIYRGTAERIDSESLQKLSRLVAIHAPSDGVFDLPVPGVYAVRRSRVMTDIMIATERPMLCLVAQGAKLAMLGREVYTYDASRMLVFSVQLPISGQVIRASPGRPFLGLVLDLDPGRVGELAQRVYPKGLPRAQTRRGLYVGQATSGIADAAVRLMTLMARPDEADVLGPVIIDEILIRLLRTSIGSRVAQIGKLDSRGHLVARAISWLRNNFTDSVTVEQLARLVHMSPSSFHQHFKAVTSMSPVQYQKALRLLEARRLLMAGTEDAGGAARRVGYHSASQFSREYARFFGNPPVKDINQLREHGYTVAGIRWGPDRT